MTKVYCVFDVSAYDQHDLIEIYSSQEAANEAVAEQPKYTRFVVEEWIISD